MRRFFHLGLFFGALLSAALCYSGEVIDRVVATVDREPILQSDWDDALAFEALQQGREVSRFSSREREEVLDRLIDRQLLLQQMGDVSLIGRPDDAKIRSMIEGIKAQFPGAQSESVWLATLKNRGFTEATVEDRIRRQLQVLGFIDLRLRPEASVQRVDVEDYYQHKFVPEVRRHGDQEENLSVVYPKIEEVIRQQRIDELLTAWLHNLRDQGNVQKFISQTTADSSIPSAGGGTW